MEPKKFQKNIENFICENCEHDNMGNGYTNHCRKCLWSKHVDINPGDREEKCHGMMEPISLTKERNIFYITHKCKKCRLEKRNKAQEGDDFNELIKASNNNI